MAGLAIEVRGLVKRFQDVVAVNGLDLEVKTGECVGLLGPNGAGKTTTLEILEGLQRPTSGLARVLGLDWDEHAELLRARIGVQLQETRFYERLTVEETLTLFRSLYARGMEVEEIIRLVRLAEKRDSYVVHLSGGQRQRLAVAAALTSDPELLFLDEPTTGLDPQARRALWDVIEEFKGRGRTIILTTHYMEEAERLCDRVVIVDHGKVVAQGSPTDLIHSLGGAHIVEISTEPAIERGALDGLPGLREARAHKGVWTLSADEPHKLIPALLGAVDRAGSRLTGFTARRATLDDVFLALTGRSLRESNEGPTG